MKANPDQIAREIIKSAAAFLGQHPGEKLAQPTFGYFTRHPVAPLNRKRLTLLLAQLQKRSDLIGRPLRVLDLACGGGLMTCAVAKLGHRALGMDLSNDEIRLAKLFAQEERLDGVFRQADLMKDSTWESIVEQTLGGKPDIVLLAYALHHLPEVELFVERLSRWLSPGAELLINEENPDSPMFRLKHRIRTWIQKDTDVEWHRSYPGWKGMLESRGFRLTEPIGADILPGMGRILPLKCWSLVFTASRT